MPELQEASKDAHIIESLSTYSVADDPLNSDPTTEPDSSGGYDFGVYQDKEFWSMVFQDQNHLWDSTFDIHNAYLSEWVARVPGLFWKPDSLQLRKLSPDFIEEESEKWTTYTPQGKSQKVMGGVGTLRLPPNVEGWRLITATCGLNASAGIPVLVSSDVWDYLNRDRPADGRFSYRLRGRWRKLGMEWLRDMPAIHGIPRGCLIVNSTDDVSLPEDEYGPVRFDPFSVMEYTDGATLCYDYVYAGVDLGHHDWRRRIEEFFDVYPRRHGRNGRHLTSADIADPLWESDYRTPAELRPNLSLLEAKVRERLEGNHVIEQVHDVLSESLNSLEELIRYSDEIGLPVVTWRAGGPVSQEIANFVDKVLQSEGKIEQLLQLLSKEKPALFSDEEND